MKKTIFILAIALSLPIVTYASWYNPSTWFHRSEITTTTETIAIPPTIATTTIKTIYVPKIISVTDPKLQKQINDLQNQVTELQQENIICNNKLVIATTTQKIQIVNIPKTRDQLEGQYKVAHPYCTLPNPQSCGNMLDYTQDMTNWVDQQLANQ